MRAIMKSLSDAFLQKYSSKIAKGESSDTKSNLDVLLQLQEVIQECDIAIDSADTRYAEVLKAKILIDYEKHYYKAMNQILGKDMVCEYETFGQYDANSLHINRPYTLNKIKLFQNLHLLKDRLVSLKKVFDKKPSIFS